jgi:hypothetical protein
VQSAIKFYVDVDFRGTKDLGYEMWVDGSEVTSAYESHADLQDHRDTTIGTVDEKINARWTTRSLQFQQLNIGKLLSLD